MSVHDEKGKIELAEKMRRFEESSNVAAELYAKNGYAAEKSKKKLVAARGEEDQEPEKEGDGNDAVVSKDTIFQRNWKRDIITYGLPKTRHLCNCRVYSLVSTNSLKRTDISAKTTPSLTDILYLLSH